MLMLRHGVPAQWRHWNQWNGAISQDIIEGNIRG